MAKISKKAIKKIAAAVQSAHHKIKTEVREQFVGKYEGCELPDADGATQIIMAIVREKIGDTLADLSEKFDADKFKKAAQPTPVPPMKVETVNPKQ